MKIYVLGSTYFMKEMVEAKNKLCELGLEGWIHPHYEAFVRGEKKDHLARWNNGEKAALNWWKRADRNGSSFCER